jgi:hypothetical protein
MSTPGDAVDFGVNQANTQAANPAAALRLNKESAEAKEVAKQWGEYVVAQAFDRNARRQYERDRRYAAGTADITYAVDANLLGSYIDILVSYIYARNPKVSVRPAEQVEIKYEAPINPIDPMAAVQRYQAAEARRKRNAERHAFAKTLQIVITRLWQAGKLKKAMKKVVRSGFSVAIGWFKGALLMETRTDPQVEVAINDLRDNMQRLVMLQKKLADVTELADDREALETELERQMQGLESNVEIVLKKMLAIDFVSAEHMQVALDVRDVDDYLEASWNANAMFVELEDARARFPDVQPEEWKIATKYTQREPVNYQAIKGLTGEVSGVETDPKGEAYQYTKASDSTSSAAIAGTDGRPVEYVKVVEKWDKRDNLIKTMVEGLFCYPKQPFAPRFGTTRFYPYFMVQFFPVDGDRHPQSLSWRLAKLQDEYANSRSSFRLTRQRSIPGIIFNASQVATDEARKLESATHGELIPIALTQPEDPIGDAFAAKPVSKLDPMLFDNAMVVGDMEKISGVQEALQTSQTVEKTATQAEIEQGGFAARTTAERDCVEEVLSDFAQYTAELALQGITTAEAQKFAGPLAFWPEGIPLEAIAQSLDVDIEAGSTGRPNTQAEREAWTTVLPLILQLIEAISLARQSNNEAMAQVYIEVLRETAARFDDRLDVDRFIPQMPPLPMLGMPGQAPAAQPGQAGAPGAPGAPSAPGGGSGAPGGGAPPAGPSAPGRTDPLPQAA